MVKMLHLFNRSELFITYTKENMEKVTHALDMQGIEYTVKTTRVKDEYTDEDIKGTKEGVAYDMSTAYKIYVKNDDLESAQRYMREALFPEG